METHPRKGVLIEEASKHQETLSPEGLGEVFESRRATWLGGKINKTHMPKSNSQQKSTRDAHIRHQQVGVEWRGGIAWGKDQAQMPWGQSEGAFVR